MKRIAIATCAAVAGSERDDLTLIVALRRRGFDAAHAVWDDPAVDWTQFALVVIRSTWDYIDRRDAFLSWAVRLPRVLNSPAILRWNTHKRYLHDLAEAGLPIIPTRFLEPGYRFGPRNFPYVIKRAVSCGARDTARHVPGNETTARTHVRRLQEQGQTVMVQPYLAGIDAKGEVALMFLGGAYSHAICRDAALSSRTSLANEQTIPLNVRTHHATSQERALAERVMQHIPGGASALLYGRVDLIPGLNGEPMILEVELTEPSLFLGFSEDGVERLADAIVKHVGS